MLAAFRISWALASNSLTNCRLMAKSTALFIDFQGKDLDMLNICFSPMCTETRFTHTEPAEATTTCHEFIYFLLSILFLFPFLSFSLLFFSHLSFLFSFLAIFSLWLRDAGALNRHGFVFWARHWRQLSPAAPLHVYFLPCIWWPCSNR